MRVWGAACQLVLGVVYALYAWATFSERWGHLAAWLIAAGGGFVAFAFSEGRGSSAFKGALGVMAYILAERGLHWLRTRPGVKTTSAGVHPIGLAIVSASVVDDRVDCVGRRHRAWRSCAT